MNRIATIVFYVYALLAAVAAVPYGLVDTIPLTAVCAIMSGFVVAAVFVFGPPRGSRHIFNVAVVLFVVLTGWILYQAHGYPPPFPENSIWRDAQDIAGAVSASISIQPADTRNAILYLALPVMTFLAGLMVMDTDARAIALLRILAIGGGLIAVFGLMQFMLSPNMLLAIEKRFYVGSLTAVYVNRNTAATHLGLAMLMLLTFAVHATRLREAVSPGSKDSGVGRISALIYGGLALAVFLALMLTQSRAGIAATAVAALLYLPWLSMQWMRRERRGETEKTLSYRLMRWAPPVLVGLTVLLLIAFSASRAVFRAAVRGLDDNRFCVWPDITRMIGDHWLTGTGFGTFRTAFSAYRDPACGIDGLFDRAHNSYLEGFATLGIIFPVALVIFVVMILWSFRRGYLQRKRLRMIAALGFAGTLLVALHAVVDFSLQIPGFAVAYSAFLAATVSICHGREGKAAQTQPSAVAPAPRSRRAGSRGMPA